MTCFLVRLLNILWSWHTECLDLTGKGKCVHVSLTMSLLLNKSLERFVSVKVVQFLFSSAGCLGTRDDACDDLVILVDSEEIEAEDGVLLLILFTANPPTGSGNFLLFLFEYLVGQLVSESIQAKNTCSLNL